MKPSTKMPLQFFPSTYEYLFLQVCFAYFLFHTYTSFWGEMGFLCKFNSKYVIHTLTTSQKRIEKKM